MHSSLLILQVKLNSTQPHKSLPPTVHLPSSSWITSNLSEVPHLAPQADRTLGGHYLQQDRLRTLTLSLLALKNAFKASILPPLLDHQKKTQSGLQRENKHLLPNLFSPENLFPHNTFPLVFDFDLFQSCSEKSSIATPKKTSHFSSLICLDLFMRSKLDIKSTPFFLRSWIYRSLW